MSHSIFVKITLLFLITFTGMGLGLYTIHQELSREYEQRLEIEASKLLFSLRKSIILPAEARRTFLQDEGYSIIEPQEDLISTLSDAFAAIPETYPNEIQESMKEGRIRILKDDRHLYVYLTKANPPLLVLKAQAAAKEGWPESLFIILMTFLLIFYLLIIRTLFPLRTLIQTINRYGNEGIYQPILSRKKDEIAMVSNVLDHAMQKNQSLLEARKLFLRNIMHELKTPITIGKLALPFLKKSEERSILERAFSRMEHLIRELVRVEQITSGTLAPHIAECNPKELIEEAAALLFLQNGSVESELNGEPIFADREVMLTVFKNLIDNAIKYSPDKHVSIKQTKGKIIFSNRGEAWPSDYSLDRLSEPFFHHEADSHSFGLGLYIIKSILEAHRFDFSHTYVDGNHHFTIGYFSPTA